MMAEMGWGSTSPKKPAPMADAAPEPWVAPATRARAGSAGQVQGNEVRATFVDDKKFGITFGGVPGNDPGSSRILKIDPAGMAAQQPQVRADPTCIGTRIAGSLASCIYPLLRYF